MADLTAAIITRLEATGAVANLLPGGIYNRPLRGGGDDAEATPDAFERSGTHSGRLIPAAVVRTLAALAAGPNQAFRTVQVWVYQPKPGRETVEAAAWEVYRALHHRQLATDNDGPGVVLLWQRVLGDNPGDPTLPGVNLERVDFTAAGGPDET